MYESGYLLFKIQVYFIRYIQTINKFSIFIISKDMQIFLNITYKININLIVNTISVNDTDI